MSGLFDRQVGNFFDQCDIAEDLIEALKMATAAIEYEVERTALYTLADAVSSRLSDIRSMIALDNARADK